MAALKGALTAGLGEDRFWISTPFQVSVFIAAAVERERLATRRTLWAAWRGAYYQRVREMPGLRAELDEFDGKKPKQMTGDEMMAAVERLNASFGGVDLRKKESTSE